VGQPSTTPTDTNSPPFNILDYAKTADEVAKMAGQLDLLLKDASGTVETPALDKRIAELNALAGRARTDAKSVLNHAFLLVAGLLVVAFALALIYRRLAPRTHTQPT
jgi:poly(3-hydroxybutyrate) depolymerase